MKYNKILFMMLLFLFIAGKVHSQVFIGGVVQQDSTNITNDSIGNEDLAANSVSTTEIRDGTIADVDVGTLSSIDVDGGNIDDTPIGANTPSTGVFTNATVDTLFQSDGVTTYYRTVANGLIEEGVY